MSTNAKLGIAVGALVALVFAVTVIAQLPRQEPDSPAADPNGPAVEAAKPGLQVYAPRLVYTPAAGRAEYREHPMYYEKGKLTVPYWVCNPNDVPITVKFGYTSCTQCSLAEIAVVPALPFDPEDNPEPFGAVFGGVAGRVDPLAPVENPPFGLNDLAYRARQKAEAAVPAGEWKRLKPPGSTRDAGDTVGEVVIPAAAAGKPVWAVIRLNVEFTATKGLETRFECTRPDSPVPQTLSLIAVMSLAEPCQVYPAAVDFKTLPEGTRAAEETVYFWSATRGHTPSADGLLSPLPPPDVDAARLPHLSFSPPVPATADETAALAKLLSPDPAGPQARVAAAYKTTLRFDRTFTADGKTTDADLGPFERTAHLTPKGTGLVLKELPAVKVKAHLLGSVRLAEGTNNVKDDKIDLGSFNARADLLRTVTLKSDAPGIELEVVPDLTEPKYLKVDPALKVDKTGDRTFWTMTLRIDAGVGGGELKAGSVVVLRIKGTGQLVRIPVTGRGTA